MEQIDFSNIPYSQHHREAAMMLGGPVNMSVFTYLLDEYLFRLRTGKSTTFKLSRNNIAETQNIHRVTVRNTLPKLEVMKLITIDGNNITVNGDNYASLIYAFHNLSNKEEKLKFANYLQTGQFSPLKNMGYDETGQFSPLLSAMSGGLDKISQFEDKTGQNYTVSSQNDSSMAKISQFGCKTGQNYPDDMAKISQFENVGGQNYTAKLDNFSHADSQTGQNYPPRLDKISQSEEIIDQICTVLGISSDSEEGKELISMICGEKEDISDKSKLAIFDQFVPKILDNFSQVGWSKLSTRNKYNKDKKIKYHDFDEKDVFEHVENSFEHDSDFLEQDEEEQETFVTLRKGGSHYKKKSFPYFPVSEVKEIISDINNCLDNDCKLFLWNFNQELHSRYDLDEELDEESGEVTRQASTDDSQFVIQEIDFTDMQNRAFGATQEMIETGFTFDEHDNKLEVTAIMDNPDRLEGIIDWPLVSIGDVGKCCKVDWNRIQNPDEEEIQEVKSISRSRRTREGEVNLEREDNKKYISAILDNASDDETWESLSPMEKLVYNFLCEYFKLKDDCNEVEDIGEMPYLNRNILFQFIHQEKEKRPDTPTQQEFVATFAKDKLDLYGGIHLRPMMFSAAKIRNWNKKHGFQSVI